MATAAFRFTIVHVTGADRVGVVNFGVLHLHMRPCIDEGAARVLPASLRLQQIKKWKRRLHQALNCMRQRFNCAAMFFGLGAPGFLRAASATSEVSTS